MKYYVGQAAEDVGDVLRSSLGTSLGTNEPNGASAIGVDIDGKGVKISS